MSAPNISREPREPKYTFPSPEQAQASFRVTVMPLVRLLNIAVTQALSTKRGPVYRVDVAPVFAQQSVTFDQQSAAIAQVKDALLQAGWVARYEEAMNGHDQWLEIRAIGPQDR